MSFRRLMTVGVLAVSAVVLPALPGSAAPSTGPGCTYPTNSPRLTITAACGRSRQTTRWVPCWTQPWPARTRLPRVTKE